MLACVSRVKPLKQMLAKITQKFIRLSYIAQTVLTKMTMLKTIIKTITQRVSASLRMFNNYATLRLEEYHL